MIKPIETSLRGMLKPLLLVGLLIGMVYFPAVFNQFVNWDDDVHLINNYFIQTPDDHYVQKIFMTTVNGTYIPLTTLSFAVEHYFFGNNPIIYHLNNILLHLAITLLIIPVALRLGLTLTQGIIASIIFGLHPMRVESVAWVTERKDVLYAFFYLLGLLTYLRYIHLVLEKISDKDNKKLYYFQKWGLLIATAMFGVLSALAKPMALSFPIILGLCDLYFCRSMRLFVVLEKLLIGIWLIPIGLVTVVGVTHNEQLPLFKSILLWSWSLIFYLYKFFFMDFFVLIYKFPKSISLANPEFSLSLIVILMLIVVCLIYRRNRLFIFSMIFYLCSIFVVLRWDSVNVVADRYMYLPSLGICLWLGAIGGNVLSQHHSRGWKKNAVVLISVVFLVLLCIKTHQQILVWKDSVTLWEHQLVYQPQAATALTYNKLASAYADEMDLKGKLNRLGTQGLSIQEQKKYQQILNLYQAALSIKPDYADSFFRLAQIYKASGEFSKSEDYYLRTIKSEPDHFEAYLDLGEMYLGRGDRPSAEIQFQKAISINSDNKNVLRRINSIVEK